jgi:signal transduction histidine kinase
VTFKVNVDVPCRADPVLLRQVFSNLIGNAVKYTRGRSDAHVDIEARQEGDAIVFSVRDNGIGFDPAQAAKLFTVFQRLHAEPQYEGSGVGLATVKRIVDRHGGRVWADSRKGDGATFYFSLPAEPSE